MVEVKLLEKSELSARFLVRGIPPSLLNTLRRIIISEVPVLAIDDVVILDNTSVLFDEFLAHRLAMIPLRTPLDQFPTIEECESGLVEPAECQVRLVLQVEAEEPRVVYAKNLVSENPSVVPVNPELPIVKLERGQRIVLEAYAKLGRARDHAKWQPGIASYYYYPKVEILNPRDRRLIEYCAPLCPDAFEIVNDEVRSIDVVKCSYGKLKACENRAPESIRVDWDKWSYVFWIESFGNMSVDEMVKETFRIAKLKFENFLSSLVKAVERTWR